MSRIYYPPGSTAPPDEPGPTPMAPVEQDLWAVVHSFALLKSKLFLDGAMTAGALATALETFRGLTQEQLGLLLAYGLESAGGGGLPALNPNQLVFGNATGGIGQAGGLTYTGTMFQAPQITSQTNVTVGVTPTLANHAATVTWCQTNFAPIAVLDAYEARIAGLEARLAAAERRLP